MSQWFNDPFIKTAICLVSTWIGSIKNHLNVWFNELRQGFAATCWCFQCHIFLSMISLSGGCVQCKLNSLAVISLSTRWKRCRGVSVHKVAEEKLHKHGFTHLRNKLRRCPASQTVAYAILGHGEHFRCAYRTSMSFSSVSFIISS